MERQTYTNTNRYLFLFLIALMVSCSKSDVQIAKSLNKEIAIYPDYKDVTIPVNIAPLNFSIADSSEHCLIIKGEKTQLQVYSDEGLFEIPQKRWKALLKENAGNQIELTIAKRIQGEWNAYTPFHMDIVNDSIDKYIAYRLLALSNDMWNRMGIYQRNLENYDQSVIYENSLTDYNCVNCHTFSSGNPDKMIFHMRGKHAGSVLIDGKKITKLNTKTPETVSNFVYMYWHPNGNYLAATVCDTYQNFFINNPNTLEVLDHNSDIVIYDVKKNEVFSCEALNSKDAWQIFPAFSPDGKSLYFSSTAAVDSISKNFRQMTYSLCRVDFDPETRTLGQQVDTLYNGRANHKSVSFPRISPDGKYLLYSSSKENITQRPFSLSSLFQVNLETLAVDTLFFEDRFLGGASYSPDGKQLLLTASPEAFDGIGKNCGNHPIANDFDSQAFIMDLATRKIQPITKDFNPTVSPLQWNRGDGCIYFNTDDGDCKNIYRYSPKNNSFEKLNLETDVTSAFTLSEYNPGIAAYIGQSDHNAGVAYLYDMKKKTSSLLADPMKPILEKIELGKTEPWNFTASDGTVITGKMCLPPNFDPNKKYPMIVYYYGGTTPTTRGISNPYCAQLFASRDYVVYVIQPSGTIGFGQEFSARHVNAWGKRTADDIIEGTKQFCKEHPFVDEKKIGCLGASYGGFMTQYLQTQTDIFAAAVSHAGISDVTSYWGEGYWGYSYNAIAAADSYPWKDPDLFTKQGSLFNADKINTPLLLLHGTVDTNVPIGESIQLFNALKILGKTVEFVTVDGENHFISDYDKRIKWHNSIMAWFARWLQDQPEWWKEMYPERHL